MVAWSSRREGSWQGGTEGSGGQQGVRVAWSGRGAYSDVGQSTGSGSKAVAAALGR